jgi:hypothetical protein
MNKHQQKLIRLTVQIIVKALNLFKKEFLKPHNPNKKKDTKHEIPKHPQHPSIEERYQDDSAYYDNRN